MKEQREAEAKRIEAEAKPVSTSNTIQEVTDEEAEKIIKGENFTFQKYFKIFVQKNLNQNKTQRRPRRRRSKRRKRTRRTRAR